MKKLFFILLITLVKTYAVVPTMDIGPTGQRATQEMAQDTLTMGQYAASVVTTMNKIGQGMSIVDQMKNLQGLQKLNSGADLCRLCTKTQVSDLQAYKNSIDDDLCSQFSLSYQNLTGIKDAAKNIGDIMRLLTTDPKAAMLSIQQAAVAAQQTTNNTLGQMQMMQAQQAQKQLATEKLSKQQNEAVGTGMTSVKY